MAETNVTSAAPGKRRRWLRVLGWTFGVLLVLLLVGYFVATSAAFFKGVIMPRASSALGAAITVSDASISPFKQVILRDLKVQTTGAEPLVTAPEVRLRYSLMEILRGHIQVDEVTLVSPTIVLVENADKTTTLDPIMKAMAASAKAAPPTPAPPAQPSKPLQLDIKSVVLTDATVRQVKLYAGDKRDTTEVSHVNFTFTDLKPGSPGKVALSAELSINKNPPAPGTNGLLLAKLTGNFTTTLSPNLKSAALQGNTRFEIGRAEGAFTGAKALNATLDCDVTPTEVKQMALRFQKGETRLGELRVSGPLDMEKLEGRLAVQLLNIDKNLLNVAGEAGGLDFGATTIGSTNEIQLAKGGTSITATGQFNINHLRVTRAGLTTPVLEFHTDYDLTADTAAGNALIKALNLRGAAGTKQFLSGGLSSPMAVSWGGAAGTVGDSTLSLAVTHLDFADWKPLLGDLAPAGDLGAKLQLLSQQGGKQLTFDLNSGIDNLTAKVGSNRLTEAGVTLQVSGKAADLSEFDFSTCKLQVTQQNQPMVIATASGTFNKTNGAANLQLTAQLLLARLLQAFPFPGCQVASGTAALEVQLTQAGQASAATPPPFAPAIAGKMSLADFTGSFGSNVFRSFGTSADLDVAMTPQQVKLRKLSGKVTAGQAAGGSYDLAATYDLSNRTAQLTAKLTDFNQNGLRPFLEAMLGDKKLVSVALNGDASVQYDPQAASTVKSSLQMTNLVVSDPKGQFPATPLEAKMQMEVSLHTNIVDIRQCQLALTPTARATNQVQLTGRVDMTQTNIYQGNLKLAADSLDVTSYYDLFMGQKAAAGPPAAATTPSAPTATTPAGPETEHAPIETPCRNFVAEASVGRFYLREVEITNLLTTVKVDGGKVLIKPCQLAVNGAPVSSTVDLDLGVAGFKYDVAFSALAVPLAPLVNSFQPERKGQLGGTFTAQAKLAGAGTTGASLQKHLSGQFDVASTNLNLAVANVQSSLLRTLVTVVTRIPDIVQNPTAAASSLLGSVTQKLGLTGGGGLSDDMSKSPIDQIIARGSMGAGQVQLQQAFVQSPLFQAQAAGTVTLAPVMSNSVVQFPVSISLVRPVAQGINMVTASTPTNAVYVKLPDFLTIKGTLGNSKSDINYLALGGAVLQGAGGLGGKAGSIIQGLLPGTGGSGTAPATTNPPATGGGLLNSLGGSLLGNPPAANNTPPATGGSPANLGGSSPGNPAPGTAPAPATVKPAPTTTTPAPGGAKPPAATTSPPTAVKPAPTSPPPTKASVPATSPPAAKPPPATPPTPSAAKPTPTPPPTKASVPATNQPVAKPPTTTTKAPTTSTNLAKPKPSPTNAPAGTNSTPKPGK